MNENLTEYRVCYSKAFFTIKPLTSFFQFIKFKKAHRQLIKHLQVKRIRVKAIQVNVIFPVALVLNLYKKAFNAEDTILEHWSGYLKQDGNYKGRILKRTTQAAIANAKKISYVSEPQKQDFAWFASGKGADHNYAHQAGNPFLKFKEIEKLIRLSTSPTCSSIF